MRRSRCWVRNYRNGIKVMNLSIMPVPVFSLFRFYFSYHIVALCESFLETELSSYEKIILNPKHFIANSEVILMFVLKNVTVP